MPFDVRIEEEEESSTGALDMVVGIVLVLVGEVWKSN